MKLNKSEKIISAFIPIVLAGILLAVSFLLLNRNNPEKTGRDVVIFGDSLMAYSQDDSSVANYIASETGLDVLDLSFGGTLMSYIYEESSPAMQRNALSMFAMSGSFLKNDFCQQVSYHPTEPATDYFLQRIQQLQTLDLKSTKTVIIGQCINDYHCGIPVGDVDSASEYTYCGALNMVITNLRRVNPDIRIIIVSPTTKWTNGGEDASGIDLGGGSLQKYIDAQKAIAEKMDVEYISLLNVYDIPTETGDEGTVIGSKYTVDGTHPNFYGRRAIADAIADYLKES